VYNSLSARANKCQTRTKKQKTKKNKKKLVVSVCFLYAKSEFFINLYFQHPAAVIMSAIPISHTSYIAHDEYSRELMRKHKLCNERLTALHKSSASIGGDPAEMRRVYELALNGITYVVHFSGKGIVMVRIVECMRI
jgi:hypothetical protein